MKTKKADVASDSKRKDPTETNMDPKKSRGATKSREDADHTGTDSNADFTEGSKQKQKRAGRFDKDKRETDPDMTDV